jgi:xylose isomerase
VPYFPCLGSSSLSLPPALQNPLAFKHYNAKEMVTFGKHTRSMEDWCRFSVCYWHTFRGIGADPFGGQTLFRDWDDGSNSMENALRRVDAAFEFHTKLGVPWYTFHDVDVSPQGATLSESNKNLDKIADKLEAKQKETGVKLLWGTANLFSHWRYAQGAATSPDAHVVAYAGAQVKKAMEVTHRLGGVNYVFWGGREGYQSILNTNVRRELDHLAQFLHMAVEHKKNIGATYQLLIEPKPREPTKHQYDYDAQTVIGFLKHYGLENHFKVNIEPNHTTLAGHNYEHDIWVSSKYGMLGSIDSNTGDPLLGWDTDQFPMNVKEALLTMWVVCEQGGLQPGGLNFDCKVRRESTDLADMFIGHIGAMDTFAKGLKGAASLKKDAVWDKMLQKRYSSFDSGIGEKIEKRTTSFKELEDYIHKNGEAKRFSGQQELYEVLLNKYA